MNAVNKLLDKYRETCLLTSDNAMGVSLGVKRQAVHQWRKGVSWPSDEHIMTMTNAIGEEPAGWMAAIQAERAHSTATKRAWLKAAQKLGWAAAVTLVVSAFYPVQAGTVTAASGHFSAHNEPTMYIMSNYRS